MSAIWITGIGLVTALGRDRESSWAGLRAGRSGARRLGDVADRDGPVGFPVSWGGASGIELRSLGVSGVQATADAELRGGRGYDPLRAATLIGMSKPRAAYARLSIRSPVPGQPTAWESFWPSTAARAAAAFHQFGGPCLAPVAACATGLVAILQAADLIRAGTCDLALCGATDASLDPLWLGAFRRMGVLARGGPEDGPSSLLRPWDRRRSGFLVGEGAAVLVVERAEHARARGAVPYAELAGGALHGDAYHATELDPDAANLTHLIGTALRDAEMAPSDIDYVNVHGTATRSNDPLECRALRRAFGAHADSLSCSANKAQIGHLLGAAGAVELAITCLAMRDRFVPPTLNLDDPDPACDLDGTPHVGKKRPIRAALKLSLGFGGHLAAVVLRQPDGARREAVEHA